MSPFRVPFSGLQQGFPKYLLRLFPVIQLIDIAYNLAVLNIDERKGLPGEKGFTACGEDERSSENLADTDLYETDREGQNLIDWVCLSEKIKKNNNTIQFA